MGVLLTTRARREAGRWPWLAAVASLVTTAMIALSAFALLLPLMLVLATAAFAWLAWGLHGARRMLSVLAVVGGVVWGGVSLLPWMMGARGPVEVLSLGYQVGTWGQRVFWIAGIVVVLAAGFARQREAAPEADEVHEV